MVLQVAREKRDCAGSCGRASWSHDFSSLLCFFLRSSENYGNKPFKAVETLFRPSSLLTHSPCHIVIVNGLYTRLGTVQQYVGRPLHLSPDLLLDTSWTPPPLGDGLCCDFVSGRALLLLQLRFTPLLPHLAWRPDPVYRRGRSRSRSQDRSAAPKSATDAGLGGFVRSVVCGPSACVFRQLVRCACVRVLSWRARWVRV